MLLQRYTNVEARMTHRITSSRDLWLFLGDPVAIIKWQWGLLASGFNEDGRAPVARQSTSLAVHLVKIIISWIVRRARPVRERPVVSHNYGRSFATIREMNDITSPFLPHATVQTLFLVDRRDVTRLYIVLLDGDR